jgi:phage terminase large subunit GpA-like protein
MTRADIVNLYFSDRNTSSRTDWAVANIVLDEPDNRGPFRLVGREYVREPLDSFGDPAITDGVVVWGTQSGKTVLLMAGVGSSVVLDQVRVLWVMPTISNGQKFSRTRLMPMLRASREIARLIPRGQTRYDFKTLEMQLGKSIIDITGSNSPGNIASTPCRFVIQDEVEKFDQ